MKFYNTNHETPSRHCDAALAAHTVSRRGAARAAPERQDHACPRTSDGYEIDLLLTVETVTAAIEIKLSANATPQDLERLEKAADFVAAEHRYVVCQTSEPVTSATRGVLDLASAIERMKRLGARKK